MSLHNAGLANYGMGELIKQLFPSSLTSCVLNLVDYVAMELLWQHCYVLKAKIIFDVPSWISCAFAFMNDEEFLFFLQYVLAQGCAPRIKTGFLNKTLILIICTARVWALRSALQFHITQKFISGYTIDATLKMFNFTFYACDSYVTCEKLSWLYRSSIPLQQFNQGCILWSMRLTILNALCESFLIGFGWRISWMLTLLPVCRQKDWRFSFLHSVCSWSFLSFQIGFPIG